ncbi:hypothetical protein ACH5RR_033920 [Cinchona calisaya]|uniref:Uncharacterized protein n=1 Tax=Cinchona calisaya TaxID=153742 RepID=A0ABD2YD64_9GENT
MICSGLFYIDKAIGAAVEYYDAQMLLLAEGKLGKLFQVDMNTTNSVIGRCASSSSDLTFPGLENKLREIEGNASKEELEPG